MTCVRTLVFWTLPPLLAAAMIGCSTDSEGRHVAGGFWDRPYVSNASGAGGAAPRAPARSPIDDAHLPPPAAPSTAAADDRGTFDEVNRIRRTKGLRPFAWNDRIHAAARGHSADQRQCGRMSHGSPDPRQDDLKDRLHSAGYDGQRWAEVVAWGYEDVPSVVDGWMHSSGHRKILLDPDLAEAAFSRDGAYWTGDFGTPWR